MCVFLLPIQRKVLCNMSVCRKLLLVCLALPMLACSGINKEFARACQGYADAILPEYERYVAGDGSLDGDSKRIRTQAVDRFRKLLDEAVND